eukprot:scaffold92022_cov26-Tisochrysis_lutea.AAC.1
MKRRSEPAAIFERFFFGALACSLVRFRSRPRGAVAVVVCGVWRRWRRRCVAARMTAVVGGCMGLGLL